MKKLIYIFREYIAYDNIQIHQKVQVYPLSRRYVLNPYGIFRVIILLVIVASVYGCKIISQK